MRPKQTESYPMEEVMYNALTITNYLILKASEYGDNLTRLKVQKVLFILQGAFLVENNRSLLRETFEETRFGPVIPSVSIALSLYGSAPLDKPLLEYAIDTSKGFRVQEKPFDETIINERDRDLIAMYYSPLVGNNTIDLVKLLSKLDTDKPTVYNLKYKYTNNDIMVAFRDNRYRVWRGNQST